MSSDPFEGLRRQGIEQTARVFGVPEHMIEPALPVTMSTPRDWRYWRSINPAFIPWNRRFSMKLTKNHVRNGAFLAVTALAVAGELWNAFDSSAGTRPWTDYLTELPWWLMVPLAVAFAAWLPLHLIEFKARKTRATVATNDAAIMQRRALSAERTLAELRRGVTGDVQYAIELIERNGQ